MISIDRNRLLATMNTLQKVVQGTRTTLPALEYALFVPFENGVRISTTDIEIYATVTCEAELGNSMDQFTVPAKKLADACKAMAANLPVKLSVYDGRVMVSSGQTKYKIPTLPANDFPSDTWSEVTGSFLIPANKLKAMLADCMNSMAKDDARYYLNGVCLHTEGEQLNVVATDGHRLAVSEFTLVEPPERKFIITSKLAHILCREIPASEDSVRVEFGSGFCRVKWSDWVVSGKLIDGVYPDYRRVIPTNQPHTALIDNTEVRSLLQRVMVLREGSKNFGIKLTLAAGKLEIETSPSVSNYFSDNMPIDFQGDDVVMGIDAGYLYSALNALGCEQVMLEFTDGLSSLLLRDPEDTKRLHVVMPMRL